MKKFIIIFFILFSTKVYSQVDLYKSTFFSLRVKDPETEEFTSWTKWQKAEIEIIVNSGLSSVYVYSREPQSIFILDTLVIAQIDNKISTIMTSVDHEGKVCKMEMVTFIDNNKFKHLYIRWKDIQVCYQIKKE